MEYRKLGKTDIKVSQICLGTMTYGEQNTEAEAHEQMDYAFANGINFFDVAEMYPVPAKKEKQGRTEEYIGTWFKSSNQRSNVVLATKVTGPHPIFDGVGFSKERITSALEGSLKRLQTDYVDLYQLHWPDRKTNYFGIKGYTQHDSEWEDNIAESVATLDGLVKAGKIRTWGISNETPWGTMRYAQEAKAIENQNLVSIQNPYNLLNRTFEVGLSEVAIREQIGLLAYSPLGFGMLSGKYHAKLDNEGSRLNLFPVFSRYKSDMCQKATQGYIDIANKHDMTPTTLALAFVNQQPFVTANIIGATTMEQLKENIASIHTKLSKEVISEINEVYNVICDPAP